MGKLWDRIRPRPGTDIFQRTQNRLTLIYSGVLMLFLVVFILIVYGLLYFIILNDQERDIQTLADQEQRALQEYVNQNRTLDTRSMESQGLLVPSENQLFKYILSANGSLLFGIEAGRGIRPQLLGFVKDWTPGKSDMRYETIQVSNDRPGDRRFPRGYRKPLDPVNKVEIRLLAASRPILQGDKQIGTLYIGKNISYNYELFSWLLFIFSGLAILFFGIALYLSHIMSKRAMAPINESYSRQREFVADASHELRTPLSIMLSSIDSLEMEQNESTDPFVRKLLINMKDEVKRMTKLVADLLMLARADTPEYKLNWQVFDLQPYAQGIVQSMLPLAANKNIQLDLSSTGPIPINADLERIKQLLYILLDNAIKYTQIGGKVRLELSLQAQEHNRKLLISVEDTGIGIDLEDQKRIFDRFYRSDKSRSRQLGGHGLGLSIAKWIVGAHRGTIQVSSSASEGSVFTISIPAPSPGSK